jgi:hypothetical protein
LPVELRGHRLDCPGVSDIQRQDPQIVVGFLGKSAQLRSRIEFEDPIL